MPHLLIINGHPLAPSFNHALADAYVGALKSGHVEVRRFNLAELTIPELRTRKPSEVDMVGDVAEVWQAMEWADHIVIVHPLWWGSMPAKLKALFDIGLQSGKSFQYQRRSPLPLGLLKGRTARLIVTSDTPNWFMALAYGNAHFRTVKNQILHFIGLRPVWRTHLSAIKGSTPQMRDQMIERVRKAAHSDVKRMMRRASRSSSKAAGHPAVAN